ncbi:MAG TPA: NUDIX hydrolase [Candidatus Megaira endosymbiont of Nemacystus decipiens]|nr:NUDIX hydrolase [Candidatus Megaera endosymbiont of Nemacystus decipiens]
MPKVGLGVLIFNKQDEILLGKRKNSHGAASWGPPGGHLEFGESFEECAIRETKEETALNITSPTFLSITNDFFEFDQKHYISIFMSVNMPENQKIINIEPHKVEEWGWFNLSFLPKGLFVPLENLILGKHYGSKNNLHMTLVNSAFSDIDRGKMNE